jgi:hypothetical protein
VYVDNFTFVFWCPQHEESKTFIQNFVGVTRLKEKIQKARIKRNMRSKDKGCDEKTILNKLGNFCDDINRDQISFEW